MNLVPPSKAEQIESLLHFKAYRLVKEWIGPDQSVGDFYTKVFTVTRLEVEEYARQKYRIEDFAKSSPGEQDGFYAIRVPSGYLTYGQERGEKFSEGLVQSENDVWHLVIEYILLRSGTGLKFR